MKYKYVLVSLQTLVLRPGQNYWNKIKALSSIWTNKVQDSRFQPCRVAGIGELPLLMPEPLEKTSRHSYHVCSCSAGEGSIFK